MITRNIYLGPRCVEKLEDLQGEDTLEEWLRALAEARQLELLGCMTRLDTRYTDVPELAGVTVLRVTLEGSEEQVEQFCRELLHLVM